MDDSARAAILESIEQFCAAFNAGDVDGVAGCYADDLVKLRDGAPPEAKSEVVERLRRTFREYEGHVEVRNDEIVASGALAFARGSFVVTLRPRAGGGPTLVRRRFVEIWRRDGGVWRVCRTLDNVGVE